MTRTEVWNSRRPPAQSLTCRASSKSELDDWVNAVMAPMDELRQVRTAGGGSKKEGKKKKKAAAAAAGGGGDDDGDDE